MSEQIIGYVGNDPKFKIVDKERNIDKEIVLGRSEL